MILVIPVFVPHAGCPHNCTFCNQKVISGENSLPSAEDIVRTIELYRTPAERFDEVQLAFYGGSFTAIAPEKQEFFLETVQPFLRKNGGFIDVLRCSTRPDCIDSGVLERLKKFSLSIVELGTQSMDNAVLAACERGHTADETIRAARLLKENGFVLGIQTMTGLPGSNKSKDLATADEVIKLQPDFVRIYPTIVVKNTRMAQDYTAGRYIPETLDEAVELCTELCEKYEKAKIKVVRLGLQSTDKITNGDGSDIVAGPYHEAFGEKVKNFRYLQRVNRILDEIDFEKPYRLVIEAEKNETASLLGLKRCNAAYWVETYGFKFVKLLPQDGHIEHDSAEIKREIVWRNKENPEGITGNSVFLKISSL